ncbi:MAG: AbgT family transporter [Cyclobacteriaceae bacterium]
MKSKFAFRIPHPVVLLFGIFIIVSIATYFLPSGKYERQIIDGRARVISGTYQETDTEKPGVIEVFTAISIGFRAAIDIVFIVIASGIMFGLLEKSKMIENVVGAGIRKAGNTNKSLFVIILTFLFGGLGIFVGYENNIAMVPIAAIVCLALNADLMLAAGIAVGGITVGFGLSPINPYTVGVGHQIAELPLFSGATLRSLLCFSGLLILALYNVRYYKKTEKNPDSSLSGDIDTTGFELSAPLSSYKISNKDLLVLAIFIGGLSLMLWGVFTNGWYLIEISAVFVIISLAVALVAGGSADEVGETVLKSVAVVAPGAFMVGLAAAIKAILEMTECGDTIAFYLAGSLDGLPSYLAALSMSASQCLINIIIPSGSGQALATLPVMIPVGDLLGLTRQTTILAYQIGDGVTNLFNPTLGGLVAMVAICRIPFDRWLKYILPVTLLILVVCWVFLLISVAIGWS